MSDYVHETRSEVRRTGMFDNLTQDLHAMYGEFVGTTLFLTFALGGAQATVTNLSQFTDPDGTLSPASASTKLLGIFFISASFGLSLFAIASIFFRFCGSIFNPNVSLALFLVGAIGAVRFVGVVVAQFAGAVAASYILKYLLPGELSVKVALGFGTTPLQGIFIEALCTSALVLSVLMLAAEKSRFTPLAPLGFGTTLFVGVLFSLQYTGGAINTARAFGTGFVIGFNEYDWIYWVGPTLGSLAATAFYYLLKYIKYEEIAPGQDSIDAKDAPLQGLAEQGLSRVRLE